jgi:sugar lactone lactonase YvrE
MIADRLVTATDEAFLLAEGPFWDAPRDRLLWVDIQQGLVVSGALRSDGTIWELGRTRFPGTVGAVAPSVAGDLLVAAADRILVHCADGTVRQGPIVIEQPEGRRLNDGKPDPAGHFLVGTLRLDGASATEELVMIGGGTAIRVDSDLSLSNGLAWSADGTVFYSVDTQRRLIYQRPWRPGTGPTGPREVFVKLDDGYPDGICLDAQQHLWVTVWGLGQVHRYAPDGALKDVLPVPAAHTSSVAFAGPQLDTLVITTATQDLTAAQREQYPLSGRLFTVRVEVPGFPQPLWSGAL